MKKLKYEYLIKTQQNGGNPFAVYKTEERKGTSSVYLYENIYHSNKVIESFAGEDDCEVLLNISEKEGEYKYIYVGDRNIYEFISPEKITKFEAELGNSNVPYPYAESESYYFMFHDNLYFEKALLVENSSTYNYNESFNYNLFGMYYKLKDDNKFISHTLDINLITKYDESNLRNKKDEKSRMFDKLFKDAENVKLIFDKKNLRQNITQEELNNLERIEKEYSTELGKFEDIIISHMSNDESDVYIHKVAYDYNVDKYSGLFIWPEDEDNDEFINRDIEKYLNEYDYEICFSKVIDRYSGGEYINYHFKIYIA